MDTITQDAKLLIHTQIYFHDLDECYREGYLQAQYCADETVNPYKGNSLEARYWSDGWWDGFYNKRPLFELDTLGLAAPVSSEQQHTALRWLKTKRHWQWALGITVTLATLGLATVIVTELAA